MTTKPDISKQPLHTFPNGESVWPEQMAVATLEWIERATSMLDILNDAPEASSLAEALIHGAMATLYANDATGGVPVSMYALLGGGEVNVIPLMPGARPEATWSDLAKGVYSATLRRAAAEQGARYVLNIGVDFGEVLIVDSEDDGRSMPLPEGQAASMVVRITAFDLSEDRVARWWLRAAPTGSFDRPVHLVPMDAAPNHERFEWRDHFDTVIGKGPIDISKVLPPGVEIVKSESSLITQLDLRWHSVRARMAAVARMEESDPRLRELGRELHLSDADIRRMLSNWRSDPTITSKGMEA
jgi:hypothetical protein